MVGRAAAFIAALASLAVAARAADLPAAPWKHDNPFCNVIAAMAPIAGGSQYALGLYAASGTTIEAHVTAISASDAYDVHIADSNLSGPLEDRQTEPVVVAFADGAKPKYLFVDSYALDRGKSTTCPSYVFGVSDDEQQAGSHSHALSATHLQALGALPCGQAYLAPQMRGQLEAQGGAYGGRPLTVVARAYLDSNGYSLREEIVESSGVTGMDQYAEGAMHEHQFTPARFLCSPVVSTIEVEVKYVP